MVRHELEYQRKLGGFQPKLPNLVSFTLGPEVRSSQLVAMLCSLPNFELYEVWFLKHSRAFLKLEDSVLLLQQTS